MTSTPQNHPSACYFCGKPASVEAGRNSYLIDCEKCGVSYELDITAAVTKPCNRKAALGRVRKLIAAGQARPSVSLEDVQHDCAA